MMSNSKGWLERGLIEDLNKEQQMCREVIRERKGSLSFWGQQIVGRQIYGWRN